MNQDEWSDAAIAAGLRRQDPTALEAIVVRYSREIFYFIRMVLSNVGALQDVEECVNDLFVSVWQESAAFDATRGSFRTWLTMRAKYLALDRRRHLLRRQVATVDLASFDGDADRVDQLSERSDHGERWRSQEPWAADSLDAVVERREEHARLHQALARLPELDRQLMYLRYFRLKSTEDIAAQTGLSKHAIDTRLWRVRKQLKVTLWEPSHGRV
ncbi:MAG: sigma-70 family RNA polymerase sigma factor [Ktedonobacterales bacterium]|nr:sigma-70 family RNA polymerase sigma factor [Ktedonobacterales bacterium]